MLNSYKFTRYHALGNDYIVMRAIDMDLPLSVPIVQRICDRNFGVGSDGILLLETIHVAGAFSLRIYNPDGSEAEKSGNGLRIFARYLWDRGLVQESPFDVQTVGGRVVCHVKDSGHLVTVDMGQVSFSSPVIPVRGVDRDVLMEKIEVGGREFTFSAATIGNPHCVVTECEVTRQIAELYGPLLENNEIFPNRTNVQFMRVISRSLIQIEIWERGAGYTLASGSSSSAAAAVAHKLGLVDDIVTVRMPGGELTIEIGAGFAIRMTGPVTRIAEGEIYREALEDLL